VQATAAGDTVNVVGTAAAETVAFSNAAITVGGASLAQSNTEALSFDGAGGLDVVTDISTQPLAFTADQQLASLSLGSGASAKLIAGKHAVYTQSLSLSASAKLDLADGSLADDDASAYSVVQSLITAGRAGAAGVVSSSASGGLTALGYARVSAVFGAGGGVFAGRSVSPNAVLVKFTYAGDANLDGKIDIADYGLVDYNASLGTTGWFNGDFNDDGKVDVLDYGIIDFNVGIQGATL
jgi:hypothetical protein